MRETMTTGLTFAARPKSASQISLGSGRIQKIQDVLFEITAPSQVGGLGIPPPDHVRHHFLDTMARFLRPEVQVLVQFVSDGSHVDEDTPQQGPTQASGRDGRQLREAQRVVHALVERLHEVRKFQDLLGASGQARGSQLLAAQHKRRKAARHQARLEELLREAFEHGAIAHRLQAARDQKHAADGKQQVVEVRQVVRVEHQVLAQAGDHLAVHVDQIKKSRRAFGAALGRREGLGRAPVDVGRLALLPQRHIGKSPGDLDQARLALGIEPLHEAPTGRFLLEGLQRRDGEVGHLPGAHLGDLAGQARPTFTHDAAGHHAVGRVGTVALTASDAVEAQVRQHVLGAGVGATRDVEPQAFQRRQIEARLGQALGQLANGALGEAHAQLAGVGAGAGHQAPHQARILGQPHIGEDRMQLGKPYLGNAHDGQILSYSQAQDVQPEALELPAQRHRLVGRQVAQQHRDAHVEEALALGGRDVTGLPGLEPGQGRDRRRRCRDRADLADLGHQRFPSRSAFLRDRLAQLPKQSLVAELVAQEAQPRGPLVLAVAVLVEELLDRAHHQVHLGGGHELLEEDGGAGLAAQAAGRIDLEARLPDRAQARKEAQVVEAGVGGIGIVCGEADLELARQVPGIPLADHAIGEGVDPRSHVEEFGRILSGILGGQDVAHRVAAPAPRRKPDRRQLARQRRHARQVHVVDLDVLAGGQVHEGRAVFGGKLGHAGELGGRDGAAGAADAGHVGPGGALLVHAKRHALGLHGHRIEVACPEAPDQGLQLVDLGMKGGRNRVGHGRPLWKGMDQSLVEDLNLSHQRYSYLSDMSY